MSDKNKVEYTTEALKYIKEYLENNKEVYCSITTSNKKAKFRLDDGAIKLLKSYYSVKEV